MPLQNASSDLFRSKKGQFHNKRLHAGAFPLQSRAMAFYKATAVWLLISAAIGWSIMRVVSTENPSWIPFFLVTAAFIVLVAVTGCKVDEPEHH